MMQSFRISDALWCILLNAPRGPNLACPRRSFSSARRFRKAVLWKEVLAHRHNRVTLAWWGRVRLAGLVSARTRSGHRVWEVDRLYLPHKYAQLQPNGRQPLDAPDTVDTVSDAVCLELLECLMQAVGKYEAERIFLRLPSESPLVRLARRAGFFPYFRETLLEGYGTPEPPDATAPPVELRPRLPEDDYPLFQLFSAATPQEVRAGLGLTFDQWRDAQDPHRPGQCQWVIQDKGRITGWLGLGSRRRVSEGELLVHPAHPELLPVLVDLALARRGFQRWLVPHYQEPVSGLLLRRGFYEVAQYTMLIKTVAAPVMSHGMAPVEA